MLILGAMEYFVVLLLKLFSFHPQDSLWWVTTENHYLNCLSIFYTVLPPSQQTSQKPIQTQIYIWKVPFIVSKVLSQNIYL